MAAHKQELYKITARIVLEFFNGDSFQQTIANLVHKENIANSWDRNFVEARAGTYVSIFDDCGNNKLCPTAPKTKRMSAKNRSDLEAVAKTIEEFDTTFAKLKTLTHRPLPCCCLTLATVNS